MDNETTITMPCTCGCGTSVSIRFLGTNEMLIEIDDNDGTNPKSLLLDVEETSAHLQQALDALIHKKIQQDIATSRGER